MARPRENKSSSTRRLRIIGGQLRGRWIEFSPVNGLRPTGDRIRETLFNWIQSDIAGSRCLDLFAGSGALGFEAASRGASHVSLVELNPLAVRQLQLQSRTLGLTDQCSIHEQSSADFIANVSRQLTAGTAAFDIVFVDPPFDQRLHRQILTSLMTAKLLTDHARVYLESPLQEDENLLIPENYNVIRNKKAGGVRYQLLQPS